jgi:hypothetical protein
MLICDDKHVVQVDRRSERASADEAVRLNEPYPYASPPAALPRTPNIRR